MMLWVAVVLGCSSPAAVSCNQLVRTELFDQKAACKEEVQQVVDYLARQGQMAKGRCVQVKSGMTT